ANLLCGRIHPDFFLGGKMKPDEESMLAAFQELNEELGMEGSEIANGILDIANANMVNALKLISVNKGLDPRDFSLMVFGGGGAMHAAFLAEALQISEIIIPVNASVFSALGMLLSDLRRDFFRTDVKKLGVEELPFFKSILKEMDRHAIEQYKWDGYAGEEIQFEYFADLRYAGQEHYVKVALDASPDSEEDLLAISQAFHKAHKKQYTFELDAPIEWVNYHLVATIPLKKPQFPKLKLHERDLSQALYGSAEVDFGSFGKHKAQVFEREKLTRTMQIEGPAIIAESATSTVLPPGFKLRLDEWGNLIVQREEK
ncbi:MAG: hydantoinase/oxoprolinase family protein, partial [Bacteroidota bacterium]